MNPSPSFLQGRVRLLWTITAVWMGAGLLSLFMMPRQEDPPMPHFWGLARVFFPGADTQTVERLVLLPVERALSSSADIEKLRGTARAGVAAVKITLKGSVSDTEAAWQEIRRILEHAAEALPSETLPPVLDEHINEEESLVLAVTGSLDSKLLGRVAREIEWDLLRLPEVKRVKRIAVDDEQLVIAFDDTSAKRFGIDAEMLAAQLRAGNRLIPGGTVVVDGRDVVLEPVSAFSSVEALRSMPIRLPSGAHVPLSFLGTVTLSPKVPVTERMWLGTEPCVGLGIVPLENINVEKFGKAVKERVAALKRRFFPIDIAVAVDGPHYVEKRLAQLSVSLLMSVASVALLLFATMGVRMGVVVSAVVPMVVLGTFAVFGLLGGSLHQISIAATVIALGMLVDNAIVVTEGIQQKLDRGMERANAVRETVQELAWPLGSATGTTIAAFLPMLLAKGATAVFTASIPLVVIIALTTSYLFAVCVTPVFAGFVLRARPSDCARDSSAAGGPSARLARFGLRHRRTLLFVILLAVGCTAALSSRVPLQFFPTSDRDMVVADIELPESTSIEVTAAIVDKLNEALKTRADVLTVLSFAGRSAPHFYYNVRTVPNAPHFGQLVIRTAGGKANENTMRWLRDEGASLVPEADLRVRESAQGPPVDAPIEVRLTGPSSAALETAVYRVAKALKAIPGVNEVRHDFGTGTPVVRIDIDDGVAARFGLSRADVSNAVYRTTRGIGSGTIRFTPEPSEVVVRSAGGQFTPVDDIVSISVAGDTGAVPLGELSHPHVEWRPAAIQHRNLQRVVTVTAGLMPGSAYNRVLPLLQAALAKSALSSLGVEVQYGGDKEGAGEANRAMFLVCPVGLALLFALLLAEFNSFRKVGIIFTSVILAVVGVVPGLLISNQPFGFMSLLGVFALVGIVVNNAIVLIDAADRLRRRGLRSDAALEETVRSRTRPILLTTGTTVVGLLPLGFSNTTLWPPLAWTLISGLCVSTVLTLLAVPILYQMLCGERDAV